MIDLLLTSPFLAAATALCMLLSAGLCALGWWVMHREIAELTAFSPSLQG